MADYQMKTSTDKVSCDSCEWHGTGNDCKAIQKIGERMCGQGVILSPAGECPSCGCLAYFDSDEEAWRLSQAAPDMLAALKEAEPWLMRLTSEVIDGEGIRTEYAAILSLTRAAILKARGE